MNQKAQTVRLVAKDYKSQKPLEVLELEAGTVRLVARSYKPIKSPKIVDTQKDCSNHFNLKRLIERKSRKANRYYECIIFNVLQNKLEATRNT